jgi:hypothetical protein
MLKIAFLTFISILALGVYASAQDPGMPDSAALGNYDCSPIYLDHGDFLSLLLWIKNDEDIGGLNLLWGINSHQGGIAPRPLYHWPLSTWEVAFDTVGFLNPDYPDYYFSRLHSLCNIIHDCEHPLNTYSAWSNIIQYRGLLWWDSLSPGDTVRPILISSYFAACASPIIILDPQSSDDAGDLPREFAITNIAPNPFNAQTMIYYALKEPSDVSLTIYDILGRKIEAIVLGHQAAGEHFVVWDASGRNSGVYFARLVAGDRSHVGRMVLVK